MKKSFVLSVRPVSVKELLDPLVAVPVIAPGPSWELDTVGRLIVCWVICVVPLSQR